MALFASTKQQQDWRSHVRNEGTGRQHKCPTFSLGGVRLDNWSEKTLIITGIF
jgi:hypothetical protein